MKFIHYRIFPKRPEAHLYEVTCTVPDPDPAGQRFSLPAWIPGSYLIRDFAKHIVQLWATAGDSPVAVRKINKNTWECAPSAGPLTVRYEVYAWDMSVRAAHLDTTHGFFNGTSVFLRAHGHEGWRCQLEIQRPEGDRYRTWRVATAMNREGATPYGYGTYEARDYEELVDHPVEMGNFDLVTFYACGYPHDVVVTGRHHADLERLTRDLKLLCEHHIRFFGEPPPIERYIFFVTATGDGYGGLEHRASCVLACSRDELPRAHQAEVSVKYRTFLGLCSHEYFHTWSVKRIKPLAFMPCNFDSESYTTLLWAFEGITSYYQSLALLRCGLISLENYLELLGETLTRILRTPGRFKQSVTESSFDAWIKLYQQDENAPNAIISYYTKGAMVGLALDLMLRRDTNNSCSLDELMRGLWRRYGQTGEGVPEDGVERMAEELSGIALKPFFDQMLRGTEDPPLRELLAHYGVRVELRAQESGADMGGRPGKKSAEALTRCTVLGVRLADSGEPARLNNVYEGGAALAAGLAAGDVIIAVDGLRATRGNLEQLLEAFMPGETVRVHVFRRDELMEFSVTLQAPPADTCVLTLISDVDGTTRARRAAWLGPV